MSIGIFRKVRGGTWEPVRDNNLITWLAEFFKKELGLNEDETIRALKDVLTKHSSEEVQYDIREFPEA